MINQRKCSQWQLDLLDLYDLNAILKSEIKADILVCKEDMVKNNNSPSYISQSLQQVKLFDFIPVLGWCKRPFWLIDNSMSERWNYVLTQTTTSRHKIASAVPEWLRIHALHAFFLRKYHWENQFCFDMIQISFLVFYCL